MKGSRLFLVKGCAILFLVSNGGGFSTFFGVHLYNGFPSITSYARDYLISGVNGLHAKNASYHLNGFVGPSYVHGFSLLNVGLRSFLAPLGVQGLGQSPSIGASQTGGYEIGKVQSINDYRSRGALKAIGAIRLYRGLIRYLLALVISTTRSKTIAFLTSHVSLVGGCSA